MLKTVLEALGLALLKVVISKSERGFNKAMSVLGLDKEYKRINDEKNAALKALEDFKKVSNDQSLTPAQKDKKHEEIADSIADKLRNM